MSASAVRRGTQKESDLFGGGGGALQRAARATSQRMTVVPFVMEGPKVEL